MKKTYLILFLLASFFSVKNTYAQANVTATGISIQGIARDENNAAIANIDQLGLTFKIYYLSESSVEVQILSQTANVKTDNFGVFSYVLNINSQYFTQISNKESYLKVSKNDVVFSNEKLQAVPYAIQAQNGVPTGTIMAYIGTTAPVGWLLCNGSAFTDDVYHAKLKELLGSTNTPNLNARYLRGTGPVTGKVEIALKGTQDDTFKPHSHGVSLTTSENGNHNHANGAYDRVLKRDGYGTGTGFDNSSNEPRIDVSEVMSTTGNHTHTISGSTANSGDATVNETRVYSYGVTWIIKI